ncbi:MAG: hypothetical protein QOH70_1357 [Blastocatellia bacterium]|jgi:hypothetical protein|nr:hypothetical protein [Blastocatellia bacterium]
MISEDDTPIKLTPPPVPPTQVDPNVSAPAKAGVVSTEQAFLDAIKDIPVIGPWLVVVFTKWRWPGLILVLVGFLTGAILVTCLFVFGYVPAWVVPDKYKKNVSLVEGTTGGGQRLTPHGKIEITEVSDESKLQGWLKDYHQFFRDTAADQSENPAVLVSTRILALKSPLSDNTTEFTWLLDSRPNYSIETARGFRVTKTGLIEPLINSDSVATHFRIPPCEKGDMLFALVMITKRRETPEEIQVPLFQSYAP